MLKIISGSQDGVDIAVLRAAKQIGVETGGWATLGFLTTSGPKPEYAEEFGMKECGSPDYPVRTALNVRDSDATLYIYHRVNSRGMIRTKREAQRLGRPWFEQPFNRASLDDNSAVIMANKILLKVPRLETLNIAGNRDIDEFLCEKWVFGLIDRLQLGMEFKCL